MQSVANLVEKFKGLWYGESKQEVEGYVIMTDSGKNKTLCLAKNGEKSWKTEWFNNDSTTFKIPTKPIKNIFNN
jgi:hypothetical protein